MQSNRLKKDLEMYRNLQNEAAELVKLTELPEDCPDINENFDKYINYLSIVGQATCDLVNKLRALKSMEKAIEFNEKTGVYKIADEEEGVVDAPISELTEVEHSSVVEV